MILRYALSKYGNLLETKPLITKSITTSLLMGLGDVIAQKIEKAPEYNYKRTLRLATVGAVITGPSLHYWYKFLEGFCVGARAPIKKVIMDQLLFGPSIIAAFYISSGLLEGKKIENIKDDFRNSYLDVLKMNYYIWPAANFINFSFVPYHYRIVFTNTVALVWNTFLSNSTQKKEIDEDKIVEINTTN